MEMKIVRFSNRIIKSAFRRLFSPVSNFFVLFCLFLHSFPAVCNSVVNRAQHSMDELKSEDKSRSCDKWRTHVPSVYVYYLCPPRRSTSQSGKCVLSVLTYILSRDHLHTFARVHLFWRQFGMCPKILIISRFSNRSIQFLFWLS